MQDTENRALNCLQILRLIRKIPPLDPLIGLLLSSNVTSTEISRISHPSPTLQASLLCLSSITPWNPGTDCLPGCWSRPHILLGRELPGRQQPPLRLTALPPGPSAAPHSVLGTVLGDLHTLFHHIPNFERVNLIISHLSDGNTKDSKVSDFPKGHRARKWQSPFLELRLAEPEAQTIWKVWAKAKGLWETLRGRGAVNSNLPSY